MLLVSDVLPEVQRILGPCDDATALDRISDATEVLCNKSDIDPLIGWVDITTSATRYITLPREVDTVLALNISGKPSFPRNRWAEFHLNGLGSDCDSQATYFWDDKGDYPLFVDPTEPVRFTASTTDADDLAAGEIWVYGFDENNKKLVSEVGGVTVDGYKVPLFSAASLPATDAQQISRVTAIRKTASKGFFSLWGTTESGESGLFGEYEPDETLPQYRRISISTDACWVRVQFRRKVLRVNSASVHIPLHSRYALMMMIKALQKYENDDIEAGLAYEEKAVRLLTEKQLASNPPGGPSIQVNNATRVFDPRDRMS